MDPLMILLTLAIGVGLGYYLIVGLPKSRNAVPEFAQFPDKYETLESVADALQQEGLESCNLVIGIDYTGSNEYQGRRTFGGRCLHDLTGPLANPYQKVISLMARTLEKFDEDHIIPAYGFGDQTTKDRKVFKMHTGYKGGCDGVNGLLERYSEVTPGRILSGPTSFAPLIKEACRETVKSGFGEYNILIIVADGQVTNEEVNVAAISEASDYPLSIVMVGVGDGPWDTMEHFDDKIRSRRFDNFQFVEFEAVMRASRNPDAGFALRALMEIPQQFQAIKRLGFLGKKYDKIPTTVTY